MEFEEKVNDHNRYSSKAFIIKPPFKGSIACDYDSVERLVEFEFTDGTRGWIALKDLFGSVITEVKEILLLWPGGSTERLNIIGVIPEKIKRTWYIKLIFESEEIDNLPF